MLNGHRGRLGEPDQLFGDIKKRAKPPEVKEFGRYPALLQQGSMGDGMGPDERRFESSYTIAPIAHVPLEARTAVAQWRGDKLTIHCGTQAPFVVRAEIAKAMAVPLENVRVIVSDTGSGYGAKHNSECELEAARLARGTDQPLRLAWTREEEFSQSYSRPAALMEVRSAVQRDGKIVSWEFHNYNGGAASLKPPYEIPNLYAAYHESESPLRQGSYRSLAATGNTFAREMHLDEIASFATGGSPRTAIAQHGERAAESGFGAGCRAFWLGQAQEREWSRVRCGLQRGEGRSSGTVHGIASGWNDRQADPNGGVPSMPAR